MKLAISEIRSQIFPQPCENSGQMIHSEHNSHFSVGLFGAEQLLRTMVVSVNDCRRMIPWKLHRRRKVFFCSFGTNKNPLTMVEVSACCSNVCIQNFVRLFELTVSNNGEGPAVGIR